MHLVCPLAFFFPRRHFASALSRQGRLLFWLISVFLLFFQNKSQGRHNITNYPKKSTAVSTMVHKPTTTVTKRRSKRSEDEWHVIMWGDIGPTSFSFSRTEKKKPLSYFSHFAFSFSTTLLLLLWYILRGLSSSKGLIGGLSSIVQDKKDNRKERKTKRKKKIKKKEKKKKTRVKTEGGKVKTDKKKERKMHQFRTES